ncbi:MAG: VWA domain-containing protein [Clostridia bacterium]|nr:VWA domain-containing protein [Clostridia bacterium]
MLVLLIDRSGSMAGGGLDRACALVRQIKQNRTDAVVLSYAGAVRMEMGDIKDISPGGLSNLGAALQAAVDLPGDENEKTVVIFSDGSCTDGPYPEPIAHKAREKGVRILCVAMKGNGGVNRRVLYDISGGHVLNEQMMLHELRTVKTAEKQKSKRE